MDAQIFLDKFNQNYKNYDQFEYDTLINIIKYCDTDTRNLFFPGVTPISGYDCGYPEIAIKLICYTISTITDYGFNQAIMSINYQETIGSLLTGKYAQGRWQDIFKRFVNSFNDQPLDDKFWNDFFRLISSENFIKLSMVKMEAEDRREIELLFEMIRVYRPADFQMFCTAWSKIVGEITVQQLAQGKYFLTYKVDDRLKLGIINDIKKTMQVSSDYSDHDERVKEHKIYEGPFIDFGARHKVIHHHECKKGQAVVNWLNSNLVRQYNLHSGATIHNTVDNPTEEWCPDFPSGCVTFQTMIKMADGTEKPIIKIQPGDFVLSAGGVVSQVSDEMIVTNRMTCLYAINDMEPFMSPEHAVMTTTGWKSINPGLANEINPHFQVSLLEQGDEVITTDGVIVVEHIPVKMAAKAETFQGYDLHFCSGNSSYYANGILVLLNYPQITASRLLSNMEKMSEDKLIQFTHLLEEHLDLFQLVFGREAVEYFKEEVYAKFQSNYTT